MDNNSTSTDEIKREKGRVVPVKFIDDFPDHTFQVKDDEGIEQLVRSVDMNSFLNSITERRKTVSKNQTDAEKGYSTLE